LVTGLPHEVVLFTSLGSLVIGCWLRVAKMKAQSSRLKAGEGELSAQRFGIREKMKWENEQPVSRIEYRVSSIQYPNDK